MLQFSTPVIKCCNILALPSLSTLSSRDLVFLQRPWSYTVSETLKNEEERKGTLVQSEMQMATEDMSNSQSGTRKRKVQPASIYKTNQM